MAKRLEITVNGKRVYSCAFRNREKAERIQDRFWPNGVISEYDVSDNWIAHQAAPLARRAEAA